MFLNHKDATITKQVVNLRDINKDYSYCSVFDARLHSESTLQRGCGGGEFPSYGGRI